MCNLLCIQNLHPREEKRTQLPVYPTNSYNILSLSLTCTWRSTRSCKSTRPIRRLVRSPE